MKFNKRIFAISLGTVLLMATVAAVSLTRAPDAPITANSGDRAGAIILASAQSTPQSAQQSPAQGALAGVRAALPASIPVPCPIWILGQIMGYPKTTIQTADGATPNPKLVPGGIWFMQKFAEAAAKTL